MDTHIPLLWVDGEDRDMTPGGSGIDNTGVKHLGNTSCMERKQTTEETSALTQNKHSRYCIDSISLRTKAMFPSAEGKIHTFCHWLYIQCQLCSPAKSFK